MIEITYREILWTIAIIMTIYSNFLYFRSIFQGKTKPHLYSYIIWSILMGIAFIWQYTDNWWPWSWSTWLGAIAATAITLLSIKYWTKNINKFDTILLFWALLSIWLYLFIQDLRYTILFVIVIDLVWYIPTIRKIKDEPYSEDSATWIIMTIKFIIGILALEHFSFLTYWYLLALTIWNIIFLAIMFHYRRKQAFTK